MSRASYFCCQVPENPWDDIFGCGGTTQTVTSDTVATSHGSFKTQDWNNPFTTTSSTTSSSRENASRPDARSVTSYDNVTNRYSGNEDRFDVPSGGTKRVTFKEPHFENISPSFSTRKKTTVVNSIFDQSFDSDSSGNHSDDSNKVIMVTDKVNKRLQKKGLIRSPIDGNRFIKKESLSIKRKLQLLVMRTETTRPKKELTPEDVRDPETVPGMKLMVDIEKEKKAQERATTMISTGEFQHNEKAGVALYTISDRGQMNRTDGRVNPIV